MHDHAAAFGLESRAVTIFFSICLMHFVAQLSPGPDVFLIAKSAVSQPYANTLKLIAGISLGILVWVVLTLFGFAALMQQLTWLQSALMAFGGSFLLYLGWQMLKGGLQALGQSSEMQMVELKRQQQFFWLGLSTNLSNPKTLIYFSSVFAMALAAEHGQQLYVALAIWIPIQTFLTFSALMMLLSRPRLKAAYQHYAAHIDLISGIIFLLFAALLWWQLIQLWFPVLIE